MDDMRSSPPVTTQAYYACATPTIATRSIPHSAASARRREQLGQSRHRLLRLGAVGRLVGVAVTLHVAALEGLDDDPVAARHGQDLAAAQPLAHLGLRDQPCDPPPPRSHPPALPYPPPPLPPALHH